MKQKLLLINPALHNSGRRQVNAAGLVTMEPLGLAYVAALTPPHWQVELVDEVVGQRWEGARPDLVGLTSLTPTAPRAYDISAFWRARGVPVVLGGIHASLCPQEATAFVDTVYTGEAENGWARLIYDFEHGRLQNRYDGGASSLASLPLPRRDLYNRRYHVSLISASRGCKYRCEFCAIWKFSHGRFRARPVEEVLAELRHVPRSFVLLFTDDNIMIDRDYSFSLFRGMAELGLQRRHAVQASLDIADDDELLAALKASGCFSVMVGLESINEATLRAMRKGVNLRLGVASYIEKIARLHAHGLSATATFILGFDGDGPDIFDRTARFVIEAGIDLAHFGLLNPTPGTDVFERLEGEGRLLYTDFPADHALYDLNRAVFIPQGMTAEQAEAGLDSATKQTSSLPVAMRRSARTWRDTGSPAAAAICLFWTRAGLRRRVFGRRA